MEDGRCNIGGLIYFQLLADKKDSELIIKPA